MAETLTESFCERCGTRYEFQAPTRLNPLLKTRGFIGGLRNYLTSQDALSDAMGDAMRSEEGNLASAQLEAFHESFNFCIDCRQYTCLNCWNDDAGRCRNCAPIPGTDDLAERLAASAVAAPPAPEAEPALAEVETQRRPGLDAWPSSDLPTDAAVASSADPAEPWPAGQAFPAGPDREPERVFAETDIDPLPEPVAASWEPHIEPELVVAEAEQEAIVAEHEPEPDIPLVEPVAAEVEPEPEPVVADAETEPEPEQILPPLRVVAWDDDRAYLVEPEPIVAAEPEAVAADTAPEPVADEIAAEPVAAEMPTEVEPEPVATEAEPEPVIAVVGPERDQPAPRMAPISDTILHFPARPAPRTPAAEDDRASAAADSLELAARRAQLDLLGLGDPDEGPLAPDRSQPQPYRSRGAAATQAEVARQAALGGSFWEASAREVAGAVGQVGVQSCGQCGLSLSANARFCRRCGTLQAQSA